jgi:hypothetical protein
MKFISLVTVAAVCVQQSLAGEATTRDTPTISYTLDYLVFNAGANITRVCQPFSDIQELPMSSNSSPILTNCFQFESTLIVPPTTNQDGNGNPQSIW